MKKRIENKEIKNKFLGRLLLLIIVLIIVYVLYKVVSLVIAPTDVSVVENGFISSEESATGYVIRD